MPNPFVYLQLQTSNHEQAISFYRKVFGWTLKESLAPINYTEICTEDGTYGAVTDVTADNPPSHWLPFISVENIDAVSGMAEQLGAEIVLPPTEVPGKGRYCIMKDPTGARLALWSVMKEK